LVCRCTATGQNDTSVPSKPKQVKPTGSRGGTGTNKACCLWQHCLRWRRVCMIAFRAWKREKGILTIKCTSSNRLLLLSFKSSHGHRASGLNTQRSSRSEEHTSELQSREKLVCRLLLEKKKK